MTAAAKKGTWGGRREGAGAKPITDQERHERRLRAERPDTGAREATEGPLGLEEHLTGVADPVEAMAAVIGLSPRVAALRPDLAARYETVDPVEHVARFLRMFCRYTQLGEVAEANPVSLGDPFELEDHEREMLAEALRCHPNGRRVYKRAGMIIARKNRKTTLCAGLSLYFASPADGEHRPAVVQAAGVKDQAGKLYDTTKAFIDDPKYGSKPLRAVFLAGLSELKCPGIGGTIKRVAGDGDNNHSLDPHVVMADELHTWKTPKQRENWKALTTAQGGRLDPFILFITTEGDGDENELAALMARIEVSPDTDVEQRRPGLTVFRNERAGLLVFRYAIPERVDGRPVTLDDVEVFKLANPAPWRTLERIREDLADPMNDDETKFRLYGNRRGTGAGRWISDTAWDECGDPELELEPDTEIAIGVDGARTRDCTAVAWAWKLDSGAIAVRVRVWACKPEKPHHVFVPGRLNNDLARDFIREELLDQYQIRMLAYDPRYFDDQADELSDDDDITTLELTQSDRPMRNAWDDFYEAIYEGSSPGVRHDGDPVLRAHVRNAAGIRDPKGWWRVEKIDQRPIDGLAAVVMAVYALGVEVETVTPWTEVW